MSYPNILFGPEGLQYKQSTSARHALGQLLVLEDGRRFRYAKNGGTAAANGGLLFQAAAVSTQFLNSSGLTVEALSAGGKIVTFTTTFATLLAANVFSEGYALAKTTSAGGAGGQLFKIKTQPAFTTGASASNYIELEYGVPAAITSGVTFELFQHPYSAVVIHASPPTNQVVGWTMASLAASAYGWLGTAGPLAALQDMDPQIGEGVAPSTANDGAVNQAYMRLSVAAVGTTQGASAVTSGYAAIDTSTGTATVAYLGLGSTAAAQVVDIGMQQATVGWAMSCCITSGQYGAVYATLDG